jgi:signal transduction histidine kinase/ligand-binding sensor domain-containing protein
MPTSNSIQYRATIPQTVITACVYAIALLFAQMVFAQNTIPQNTIPQNTIPQNTIPQNTIPQNNLTHQTPSSPETYYFSRISIERGLSQSSVYAMTQDKKGFLWFGTQDGLNMFDGYSFKVIHASKQQLSHPRTSFPNGWLVTMLCDKHGNIWTGMNGSGLVHVNRTNGSLLMLTADTLAGAVHKNAVLSSMLIIGLVNDTKGRVWIATDKGLDVIESPKAQYTTLTLPHIKHIPHPDLNNGISAIASDSVGNVWIAGNTVLVRYSTVQNVFDEFPLPAALATNTPAVQTLFVDKLGRVWVGTTGKGVLLLNPVTRAMRTITHAANNAASLANDRVYAITTDERGYLWCGTDNGVSILERDIATMPDDAAIRFVNCRYYPGRMRSLSDNAVRSLLCDRSGTMWVGTLAAGLSSWNTLRQRFGLYSPELGNAEFLPNRVVRSFYPENDSIVWIGTDGGLAIWHRRHGNSRVLHPDTHPTMTSPRVWTINPDPANTDIVWLGTDGGGLYRYNTRTQAMKRYEHDAEKLNGLTNNRVRNTCFDRAGNLWIGTMNGLNRFNTRTENFTHFFNNPSDSTSLSNNRIQTVFEDASGTLWVGTTQGLNRFDPMRGVWRRYVHTSDTNSLTNDWVKHITQTRDGMLWISTVDGICSFDVRNEKFRSYGIGNGLISDYVYGIVEDNSGDLWMGTDNGLARFNRKTASFRVFELADGLQSNEFNTNAFCRNTKGELFFGGVSGFNVINPARLGDHTYSPTLCLTGVRISNAPYASKQDVAHLREIFLTNRDNVVEFSFAALDFANSERIQYSYQLEGIDEHWSAATTRNFATYTNLDPSEYTFRVRATNSDGVWNKMELAIAVHITPPFWATWWFRTITLICLASTTFILYRWRINRIALRSLLLEQDVGSRTRELQERTSQLEQSNTELSWTNERLNDLNNEKNAILGIAAHDLKTPLGTILTITELLEDNHHPPSNEEVRAFASMIRQTSERMLGLIKQVLDMNMIDEGKLRLTPHRFDLRDTLDKVVNDTRAIAHQKNITIHYTQSNEPLWVFADHIACIQVLENILSNAVKYSPLGKNIWVETHLETHLETYLETHSQTSESSYNQYISIRDEGQGFSEKDKLRLFTKFARLSARPTGGEHSTGLGLSIVKKLVEAMRGEVTCVSEKGKGATFTVILPEKNFV